MRIPLYRTQAAPTNEAPGQPIRARMSMEPFVNEALSKGAVAGEALKQMGEFARMRYEMATQEKLDNALLRAEEELRTTAREMESRNMVGNVLDGDKPLWNQSISDMRNRLQSELGRDRKANAIFNERFGQMELTQRFALRGAIDAKMERQIAAAREQRLTQAENDIANGTDIATLNLALGQVGVDSARLGQLGFGNPEALTRQEYELLRRGTARAAMNYIDEQNLSRKAASELHEALREGDPSKVTDARGLYVYNLMEKLRPDDRVSILRSVNGISEYVNQPTLEEEQIGYRAQGAVKQADSSIASAVTRITNGGTVPEDEWAQIGSIISSAEAAGIDPAVIAPVRENYNDASYLRNLSNEVKIATPLQLDRIIIDLEGGATFGGAGIDTRREELGIKFLRSFKTNMEKSISEDGGLSWGNANGQVTLEQLDTSFIRPNPEAAQMRIRDALKVRDLYRPTPANTPPAPPTFLTKAQADEVAANFERSSPLEQMQMLSNISSDFGDYAPLVIGQVAPKAPIMGHVAGLLSDGRGMTAEKVLAGQALLASGNKPTGFTPAVTEPVFREMISSSLSFLTPKVGAQLTSSVYEAATAYYASESVRRGLPDFDATLWEESILAATGYDPATRGGGLQYVRDIPTLLPPSVSAEEAEKLMEKLVVGEGDTTVSWNRDLNIDADVAEALDQISTNYRYKAMVFGRDENGRQVYALTYGQYGEDEFAVMTDADGRYMTFTFEALREGQ